MTSAGGVLSNVGHRDRRTDPRVRVLARGAHPSATSPEAIRQSPGTKTGAGMATAAIVIGWISLALEVMIVAEP